MIVNSRVNCSLRNRSTTHRQANGGNNASHPCSVASGMTERVRAGVTAPDCTNDCAKRSIAAMYSAWPGSSRHHDSGSGSICTSGYPSKMASAAVNGRGRFSRSGRTPSKTNKKATAANSSRSKGKGRLPALYSGAQSRKTTNAGNNGVGRCSLAVRICGSAEVIGDMVGVNSGLRS